MITIHANATHEDIPDTGEVVMYRDMFPEKSEECRPGVL